MNENVLDATVNACRALINTRFPDFSQENGAAAMLLGDGTIVTGTSPEATNPSVQVCHEIEPYCAAFRLGQPIVATVCLHRTAEGEFMVLSPCGVCRERLATHGPGVRAAVADPGPPGTVKWRTLRELLPDYWAMAFPEEVPDWVE